MLPVGQVPSSIHSVVRDFCAPISSEDPIFVDVRPEPWALPKECYLNVRRKVDEEGGRIVFGWAIWLHGQWFIEGEHHGVYEDPDGHLIDITPHSPRTDKIVFLPDKSAVFDFDTRKLRDNHRKALWDDPRLHLMLSLFSEKTALLGSVQSIGGTRTLKGVAVTRYREIESEIMWLCAQIRDRPL